MVSKVGGAYYQRFAADVYAAVPHAIWNAKRKRQPDDAVVADDSGFNGVASRQLHHTRDGARLGKPHAVKWFVYGAYRLAGE